MIYDRRGIYVFKLFLEFDVVSFHYVKVEISSMKKNVQMKYNAKA